MTSIINAAAAAAKAAALSKPKQQTSSLYGTSSAYNTNQSSIKPTLPKPPTQSSQGMSSAYSSNKSSIPVSKMQGPQVAYNYKAPPTPADIKNYNPFTQNPAYQAVNNPQYTSTAPKTTGNAEKNAMLSAANNAVKNYTPTDNKVENYYNQPSNYSSNNNYIPEQSYSQSEYNPINNQEQPSNLDNFFSSNLEESFSPSSIPSTAQPISNFSTSSPLFNPYDDQLKALKSRIDEMNNSLSDSLKPSQEEQEAERKLKEVNAQLQNLAASRELGIAQILEKPIALQFQTGQVENLKRNAAAQAGALEAQTVPLRDQLSRLQADRQNRFEINKYQLGNLQNEYQELESKNAPKTMEVDGNIIEYIPGTSQFRTIYSKPQSAASEEFMKPIEVGSGGTLVDPKTGRVIYSSPAVSERDKSTNDIAEFNLAKQQGYKGGLLDFKRDVANLKSSISSTPTSELNKLLSPNEAKLLGVPYGTSRGDAAALKITPQVYNESSSGFSGLSSTQIKQIESSPEAKKLQSIKDLKNKLQAYRDVASQSAGFDVYGSRKATLDSLYADLKIAYKDAAGLGALTGPDLTLLSEAIKPMSGITNYASYLSSGGQKGVLNSIDQALKAADKAAVTNYSTLLSKYNGYQNDPYIQNLGEGVSKSASIDPQEKQKLINAGYSEKQIEDYLQKRGFNQPLSMGLNGSLKPQAEKKYPTGVTGGQCGDFAHKLVDFPSVGDGKLQKFKSVDKFGIQANEWRQNPKVGDVLITDENPTYGHVAVVNEILPNGMVRLSESNFRGKEKVSHDRLVSLNSTKIYGAIRGKLKV